MSSGVEKSPGAAMRGIALVLVAGIPLSAAAWVLLAPRYIVSSEMTWDLLFNLAGAWQLQFGHVPHVDFHEPVGALTFRLTQAGFWLLGPTPKAVPMGMVLVAAVLFPMACLVGVRRLSTPAAILFVVFVCLIVLRPANVGDHPNAFSFAMAYNRYGWSGLAVLGLLLFEPPTEHSSGDLVETVSAAIVLAALFYLKITYFAVGAAALLAALAISPHVRRRWPAWTFVLIISTALIVLPANRAYMADLAAAAAAGIVRDDAAFFFNDFAENAGEYAVYFAAVGVAAWLWRRGQAPARLFLAAAFLLIASLMLLSQNSQAHGIPLAVVIAFLFHAALTRLRVSRPLAVAVLIFPVAAIVGSLTSLASYHARLGEGYLYVVGETNLKGLAVPREPDGLLADIARGRNPERLFGLTRQLRPRYELSPFEYVQTLIEAATLLTKSGLASRRIAVLDQVDPLPFMLGVEPPRGGNVWSGRGAPTPSPAAYLADAQLVMVPKFTTNFEWTETAKKIYAAYLAEHFPVRVESRSWTLFERADLSASDSDNQR